ncbi:actin-binding protein ipp [Anaeramoeba ignava]|uniref:Actin-binding protein ipp n=1 Tax=Anaeramoeba ignava TaxID=1746090 RepID=A0A9Q0LQ14_ANAIG|nr:actin-binding protein ipp [Anaeramoeba ignava]|eukprot:Anaeramoba_ignava/a608804_586.p1 GENE.a608804_586~~a608804_586.p1  ORF type:complete len:551 (-),score=165.14 a608804_586:37-1689(-)
MSMKANLIDLVSDFRKIRKDKTNAKGVIAIIEGKEEEKLHKEFVIHQCPQLRESVLRSEKHKKDYKLDFTKVKVEEKTESIKPEVAEQILDFIYTGEIEIDENNVLEIYKASILLENEQLAFWCEDFIKESITNENVIGYIQVPWIRKNAVLFSTAMTRFEHNLSDIIHSKDRKWTLLPKEVIISILDSDNINIYSELDLFEMVINWIVHKLDGEKAREFRNLWRKRPRRMKENAKKMFKEDFLKRIRFPLMSKGELGSVDTFHIFTSGVIENLRKYATITTILPWLEDEAKKVKDEEKTKLENSLKNESPEEFRLPESAFKPRRFSSSKIDIPIQDKSDQSYNSTQIKDLIKDIEGVGKENFDNPIFSTKKDRFSVEQLHENCKDIKSSWFVFFTTDKNDIIMGFSTKGDYFSDDNSYYVHDDKSFIGVLQVDGTMLTKEQFKKYGLLELIKKDNNGNGHALIHAKDHGPIFGDYDIGISETLLSCYSHWGLEYLPYEFHDKNPYSSVLSNPRFWEMWFISDDKLEKKMGTFYSRKRHRIVDLKIFSKK